MSKKYRFLAIAAVLIVLLLAVFAGASCTGNVSADDEVAQGLNGQKGIQGQNYNGDRTQLRDGDCDGICQGNCNGNCNGECDGDCDGTGQGNCYGECDGDCNGPQAGTAGGRWSGAGGCCPGGYNGTLD